MKTCLRTWDWSQRDGWVFTPTREGPGGRWRDVKWRWPQDRARLVEWYEGRPADLDLYWSPLVFLGPKRSKELVAGARVLYADLDPVDPEDLKPRPTEAWESSPRRYHALWRLTEELTPQQHEALNRALSRSIGADPGGWDLTQVLRIPGTKNLKYKPPADVQLLWELGRPMSPLAFDVHRAQDQAPRALGATLAELLERHRARVPRGASERLQYPPSMITKGARSEMLWRLESELVEAKIPVEDVVEMVRLSPWNKFRGRPDEVERLRAEVQKVYDEHANAGPGSSAAGTGRSPVQGQRGHERADRLRPVPYGVLMAQGSSKPGWLVEKMWLRRSHGIVAGEPKTFKSTLTLDLAVSVASGKPLWDQFEVHDQGPVVIVQNENADWIQQDRLAKIAHSKGLGGKVTLTDKGLEARWPTDLPIYSINNAGFNLDSEEDRGALEDFVLEVKPSLVIFDPLYLMFQGDVNSAKELQPALQWLMALRNEAKTSVMLIHHWNKNGQSPRGGQRMLGSTTLHGWTESGLFIQQAPPTEAGVGVTIEREFRAAGMLPKLDLSVRMGDVGDATYAVTVVEANDAALEGLRRLLDESQAGWISLTAAARDLGVHRRRIKEMVDADRELEIFEGPRQAKLIRRRAEGRKR